MKTTHSLKQSVFALMIAFGAMACSDNKSSVATINGSVQSDQSSSMSKLNSDSGEFQDEGGSTVYAAEPTSNGNFNKISGTETTTNASGNFRLNVDIEAAQNIVIIAERGDQQWMGFLSSHVEGGKTYTLKPINLESTAETMVFARVVANGHANIVHKADIDAVVDANLAARIHSNATSANTIATGLANAAQARAEFFARNAGQNATRRLDSSMKLVAEAHFKLETSLSSATTVEQRNAAYELFFETMLSAYAEAGFEASKVTQLVDIWARVMMNSVASASTEIRNNARASVSLIQALAIDKAVRAEAQASGVSQATISAIVSAGVELRNAVKASAGVRSQVEAAFESYREEVRNAISSDSSIEGEVFIGIHAEMHGNTGAATVFRSATSLTVNATVVNTAYATFSTAVRTLTETRMTGVSTARVSAVSNILVLLNLGA